MGSSDETGIQSVIEGNRLLWRENSLLWRENSLLWRENSLLLEGEQYEWRGK